MDIAAAHAPPPLHDLLGASFVFNTTTNALVWDGDAACFGLADGAVARLLARWPGAPHLAPRPGGGIEIVGSGAPPPPPKIIGAHRGAVLALAVDPLGGVVSGGADGRFLRLADSEILLLAERKRRRIAAVAAGRGDRRAYAAGRQVDQLGPEQRRLTMTGAVAALRYDPSGLHLAIGYEGGVSLEACAVRRNPLFKANGAFKVMAWDAAGGCFAAGKPGGGVVLRARSDEEWLELALEQPVVSLGFTSDDRLVIGCDEQAYVWDRAGGLRPLAIGHAGPASGPVACHPRLGLVACAARQGSIVLCRPGVRDVMVIREAGAAPVALAFAPDGEALAFATNDGEAGTVILPDSLFRRGETKHG